MQYWLDFLSVALFSFRTSTLISLVQAYVVSALPLFAPPTQVRYQGVPDLIVVALLVVCLALAKRTQDKAEAAIDEAQQTPQGAF
jgi:hypothetical protein